MSIALVHVSDDLDLYDLRPRLIWTIPGQGGVANHSVLQEVVIRSLGHAFVPVSEFLPIGCSPTDAFLHFGNQLKPLRVVGKGLLTESESSLPLRLGYLKPTGAHRLNSYLCLTGGVAIKIGVAGALSEAAASARPDSEDQNAQDCRNQSRTDREIPYDLDFLFEVLTFPNMRRVYTLIQITTAWMVSTSPRARITS